MLIDADIQRLMQWKRCLIAVGPQQACPSNDYFQGARASIDPGSIVCDRIFGILIPIICLSQQNYHTVAREKSVELRDRKLVLASQTIDLDLISKTKLVLSETDHAFLKGDHGNVAKAAMETICVMAAVENASSLINVDKGHIDGCILAHDANLIFAEKMAQLGAQVIIPTTINAISVDRENWQNSGLNKTLVNGRAVWPMHTFRWGSNRLLPVHHIF